MRKLARLLKAWRKRNEYDQAKAAKKLSTPTVKCSQSQVSLIERQMQAPREALKERILKVCA
jgi:hypothetical protein